jgi:putative transposase
MSKLRRYYSPGNIYFVTTVTHERKPILTTHDDLLRDAMSKFKARLDHDMIAWVIMPDHAHFLIDPKESNLSSIVQRMKMSFAKRYMLREGTPRAKVWQSRFWDHIIRDIDDMRRHLDYIHYNPVRHGYVKRPSDWGQSSFEDFLKSCYYEDDWGNTEPAGMSGDFGE